MSVADPQAAQTQTIKNRGMRARDILWTTPNCSLTESKMKTWHDIWNGHVKLYNLKYQVTLFPVIKSFIGKDFFSCWHPTQHNVLIIWRDKSRELYSEQWYSLNKESQSLKTSQTSSELEKTLPVYTYQQGLLINPNHLIGTIDFL